MRNIAMRLAYDGTHFVGSQWQPTGRSIQGELEAAWAQLTQEERRFTLSGRTDSGVHAQGQVANILTETHHSVATVQRACNALLPDDVAVLEVWDADIGFHARRSAVWRWYRYVIDAAPVPMPLLRHRAVHVRGPLDRAAMHEALLCLPGQHDFAAFTSVQQPGSTVRHCRYARCGTLVCACTGRSLVVIDLVANAFLRHMVRAIVGTLLLVGRAQMTPAAFAQVLAGRDRRQAGPTAAAHGLMLMAVGYTEEEYNENLFTEGIRSTT